jgi:hypothetical protein
MRSRVAVCVAALTVALAMAAPAGAAVIHVFKASLAGGETPAGSFAPLSVAVDSSASPTKLYVGDNVSKAIDRFEETPSGSDQFKYECQITGKGEHSTSPSECDGVAGSPEVPGGLGSSLTGQTTVDGSGDLFYVNFSAGALDEFAPSGAYLSSPASLPLYSRGVALGPTGETFVTNPDAHEVLRCAAGNCSFFAKVYAPQTVAVDDDPSSTHFGYVYVPGELNEGKKAVDVFSAAGALKEELTGAPGEPFEDPYAVAVDPTNGRVYVTDAAAGHQAIFEFEASGAFIHRVAITGANPPKPYSIAVDRLTGALFLADYANHVVDVYRTAVQPNVTTQAETSPTPSSVTLNGEVDPETSNGGSQIQSCRFEYGETTAYGHTVPCSPSTPYTAAKAVSATAQAGLSPQSTYHYRLRAENAEGIVGESGDTTFTTAGAPSVDYQSVEALQTTAEFRAHINPWGAETTCEVQYVPAASFQASQWAAATTVACPKALGSGFGDVTANVEVTGLARATEYEYRFVARNGNGASERSPGTFETYGIHSFLLEDLGGSELEPVGGGERRWKPGEPATQAGGHPYELVTTVALSHTNEFARCVGDEGQCAAAGAKPGGEVEFPNVTALDTKDIRVKLPPGLIGNPTVTPRCTRYGVANGTCPADTQVGWLELWADPPGYKYGYAAAPGSQPKERELFGETVSEGYKKPIYNLEPSGASPAEFGTFIAGQAPAWITFHVRTGGDYGISADSLNIVSTATVNFVRVRVWGVPFDPRHNVDRAEGCAAECDVELAKLKKRPLVTDPTACSGPLSGSAEADTWQEKGIFVKTSTEMPGFTGCGSVPFEPSFEAQPTTAAAESPTGLNVDLHVPQPEGCKEAENASKEKEVSCENAEADLKNATVTLPPGLVVNPSSADGLEGCPLLSGKDPTQEAREAKREVSGINLETAFAPNCPKASKLGTVEVDTPLVEHPLPGAMYLAQQGANPFKSLLALYLVVNDPVTGVVIKLPGKITADPATGQLTTTFDSNPQLPFEDLKVNFFSGSRAPLTTPLSCGSYSLGTDLTPWSAPEGKDALPSGKAFTISSGCAGSEAQAPNAPGFAAGTASPVAGSYSPFVLHLQREDGSQRFSALNVTLPPGLTGKIAGVEECPEADIAAAAALSGEGQGAVEQAHPSCPTGSEVGVVHVGAGSGAPYFVTGHAYFAGPYKGAPFSMVFITPAIAGPFDLGTVVVRAALYIDPNTAQVTVKSDPFPTILDGIPLDIRSVNVDVDRHEFTLNPTSCDVMSVTGQEVSTAGQTAALSDRFQAGGCTTLPFHPVFSASTSGVTSRKEGASLTVHVGSGPGQANIAKVHVDLPRQLPSRQESFKYACTEGVFAVNPAACPEGSRVGSATAVTPLLSSPLTGPAYFVSHGGAAFPDLEIVLQGEGVTLILDGKTNINKAGITSSSFDTVPDAPVSSFTLTLPEGPHSILAAPGGLCSLTRTVLVKKKVTVRVKRHGHLRKRRVTRRVKKTVAAGLVMPTAIQGQNGALIRQSTPIAVTGCPRHKALVKHKKKAHAKHKKRKAGKKKHGK